MLSAIGVLALCLAVPGAALAHKGNDRHKGHDHKGHHFKGDHHRGKRRDKHKARHASVRFVHFGAALTPATPTSGTGAGTNSAPTPTPTTASEDAGSVVSYEKGMLKLELANKSTVEGAVTGNTEIECLKEGATLPPPSGTSSDQSSGDGSGQSGDQESGDQSQQQSDQQSSGSDQSGSDQQQQQQQQSQDGQDQSDDNGEQQSAPETVCDTSDLTPGTVVRSAELRIGPAGSQFESLVLVLK